MAGTASPPISPSFEVTNPRTGAVLYTVDEPGPDDLAAVYSRARKGFERLRAMTIAERLREVGRRFSRPLISSSTTKKVR